ncbi:uncharacterized membrane protein YcaP (DUF421 family) [Clostridium pascui]|uniref:DUF421 domain-containing protein n=1 Tax=Clostridium pascui TaxID=46609 RepID=UPI00195B18EF|nr:DUF421 domain-containing protein [Clostridium pascui]MBM7871264.1 uncharacterized membrane protein YcaP (DUF421 family) [Clostridium pascui]
MEMIKEFAILFGRIVTIFPLMLAITLYMGKRSIGELPVFDFLVIVILGAVVGADIADPNIEHIHTAVAIVLMGIFQKVISRLKIKYRRFGHIITFEPTIVIQDGKFLVSNLTKIRYSIDNILQMLREKEVFDISEVYLGIVEANGNISILKKPNKAEVTIEDMNLNKKESSLSYPIIVDGILYNDTLIKLNLSENWLREHLSNLSINSVEDVFFASINMKKELHVSLKKYIEDNNPIIPLYN